MKEFIELTNACTQLKILLRIDSIDAIIDVPLKNDANSVVSEHRRIEYCDTAVYVSESVDEIKRLIQQADI